MQQFPHIYRVCIVDATRRINHVESKTSRMPTPLEKKSNGSYEVLEDLIGS